MKKKAKRSSSQLPNWEHALRVVLAGLSGISANAYADTLGIAGGQEAGAAYAAFVSSDGTVTPISPLPNPGEINAVDINASGIAIIGGRDNTSTDAYAAFVSTDGIIQDFSIGSSTNCNFTSAHISASGLGLVGGYVSANTPYVAFLSQDGTITPFDVSSAPFNMGFNSLTQTDLNDSGIGLIGGEGGDGGTHAFAAYIYPNGDSVPFSNQFPDVGSIACVSISNNGSGLVAGRGNGSDPYAALINLDQNVIPLSGLNSGSYQAVAINATGSGIMGGSDGSGNAYASLVAPNGTLTELFDPAPSGSISSVDLNNEGVGIIAGTNGGSTYAAIVESNGALAPIFDSPPAGSINAVAINDQKIGLLGGSDDLLFLIAPNGTVTQLDALIGGSISSTSLKSVANNAVPKEEIAPSSSIYSQLTMASAQGTRLIQKNHVWRHGKGENPNFRESVASNQLAFNEELNSKSIAALSPQTRFAPKTDSQFKNSFWMEPFGTYVHLKGSQNLPNISNQVGGFLIGYDREGEDYLVGASFGYAFNYISYSQRVGHGKLQEELGSLYGAYYANHFWTALSIWGGGFQLDTTRHTLGQVTSYGKTNGWILTPQLEMASPWEIDNGKRYYVEPFVSLEYINSWQAAYTETGAAGFNLQMPSVYNSLLQSEVGLRFYQRFLYNWGDFCLEEKASYVNQKPFGDRSATTSFVGGGASFPVAVGNSETQNLGSFQILGAFVPKSNKYYGGLSFETMAGSSFQYYFGSAFWGVNF